MASMVLKAVRALILILLLGGILLSSKDTLNLGRTEATASPYLYGLVEWEASNFFSKWIHKVATSFPWTSYTDRDNRAKVDRYFQLGEQIRGLQGRIERTAAQGGQSPSQAAEKLESEMARLVNEQKRLRNHVEEFLESELSAVLKEQGLASRVGITFPPTDFRLAETPSLLVTSPRRKIERKEDVLLRPGLTVEEMERLEESILKEQDLSSLVMSIGGIATYPAIIPPDSPPRDTLDAAAHEWLHHYLFFKPLGQHFQDSPNMASLNETVANIAGNELGKLVCLRVVIAAERCIPPEEKSGQDQANVRDKFNFNREMSITRLRAEELLSEKRIQEAETYMEERRRLFVENGYLIRKLNQAYFAFHGTYADAPASISPIGDQLKELRRLVPTVGDFIKTASRVSSYEEFLALLDRLRAKPS